tara:strand:+ start:946 stop:1683 length:738 start_codon:yes stop_codon:yes gene_type:complete
MKYFRVIPRLDIKGNNLIKSINLEGLRKIGDPNFYAKKYYEEGADEILYVDCVASLYGRNSLNDIIQKSLKDIYVPITVGGGIRTVENVEEMLNCGADKVAINTAAVNNPSLINNIANKYGSSTVVVSIEAKKNDKDWEVYTNNGRDKTGINVKNWIQDIQTRGAGEILLTSVDREGTKKGFDIDLYLEMNKLCNVPLIASGGMGNINDSIELLKKTKIDAIAIADILHYNREKLSTIKESIDLF